MKSLKETLVEAKGKYPEWLYEQIYNGMKCGWIWGDNWEKDHRKWGFTQENYKTLFFDVPEEQIDRCVNDVMKREKIDFLYKTKDDARNEWPKHHIGPLEFQK